MKILVTGAAGFIGSALALRLLERGDTVCGIDNMNDYYDVRLKETRLQRTKDHRHFEFQKLDIIDREAMAELFQKQKFDAVMHLAAQAGVRYSITHPQSYIDSNLVGFGNILEGCRHSGVKHLVFASSSSVYGANTKLPFSEHDNVDHPVSLYAATKKANELMAHCYSHLYDLPCTGLRFFTVYGPWGRPDMALFKFTKGILEGEPIPVFNHGKMIRDFTYIDDIVEGIVRVIDRPASPNPGWSGKTPDPATSYVRYRIYNIGNNQPVELMRYIEVLEKSLGKKAKLQMLPMQEGDVPATSANVESLENDVGFRPRTSVEQGVARFVEWYKSYHRIS
ncbi:NAD-dependent epimerase [Sulfuricaulis sp.]|jgi:UDP-glucuronate 4-epimerase|uniref:NAD-dependent epimerase n=1 Tax=Sulfuricaulis sp. TaxID=2003553 RepID=UPI003559F742